MQKRTITRREFGKTMAAAGAVLSVGSMGRAAEQSLPIGIQLYTVRDLTREKFKDTLKKVADIGYPAFEFAGYGGMQAKELKTFLDELGVKACGTHEGFNGITGDTEAIIEFNKAIGNTYIVCPSMPHLIRQGSAEMVKDFANDLNVAGYKLKKAGMQLCYHNHSFEFEKRDGKTIFDLIFENSEPDLVQAEIDLAWAVHGGVDPVEIMDKYPTRVPLLHVKDITKDGKLVPVGKGVVPFKKIFKKAKEIGVDWYIVEQDSSERPILEAIEISYKNLVKLLS